MVTLICHSNTSITGSIRHGINLFTHKSLMNCIHCDPSVRNNSSESIEPKPKSQCQPKRQHVKAKDTNPGGNNEGVDATHKRL